MPIPTETYEAVFEQYSAAMRWMAGLGIKTESRKNLSLRKVVGHWKDAYKTATADEGDKYSLTSSVQCLKYLTL